MLYRIKIFPIQIRCCHQDNIKRQILHDAFGLNPPEMTKLIRKVRQKNHNKLIDSIKMCRSLGFSDEEIVKHPSLLNGFPIVLEQHYMTLEEGGFIKITPYVLSKYRKFYSERISELKQEKYLPEETNVAESFGKYFDPQPEEGIMNYKKFCDNERWRDVHYKLLKSYVKWRLGATQEEVDNLFRIHHMVQNKSIRFLCENIKLALDVGITLKRMIKCGYLLHSYPKYTKEVLNNFSNIAGGDLKRAIVDCPKLFMISPTKYAEIYGILKEYNISDEAIRKQLNIFQLSPETVRFRLGEIEKTPELNVLKNNDEFLKLIVHHQRVKSRMCFLQDLQMRCIPLKILSDATPIEDHIKSGKDLNIRRELFIFLKDLMQCEPKHYDKVLMKHPFYLSVPFVQIRDTFDYLKSVKFKTSAICKVASILLYPKEKIKEALHSVRKLPYVGKIPVTQVQRLNLALYTIEKKYHFSGNGVWPEPKKNPVDYSNNDSENK